MSWPAGQRQVGGSGQRAAGSGRQSAVGSQQSAVSSQQSAVSGQQAAAASGCRAPASCQRPAPTAHPMTAWGFNPRKPGPPRSGAPSARSMMAMWMATTRRGNRLAPANHETRFQRWEMGRDDNLGLKPQAVMECVVGAEACASSATRLPPEAVMECAVGAEACASSATRSAPRGCHGMRRWR